MKQSYKIVGELSKITMVVCLSCEPSLAHLYDEMNNDHITLYSAVRLQSG